MYKTLFYRVYMESIRNVVINIDVNFRIMYNGSNMNKVKDFLSEYGFNEKQINIYLACLELGSSGVTEIARKAGNKRPGTYLILNDLVKKGLVDLMQEKDKTRYFAQNPKKIFQKLENLQEEKDVVLSQLLNVYKNKKLKPTVNVFDDYRTYEKLSDDVREFVKSGKEALYFGNSEFFFKNQTKSGLWFRVMKHKGTKCREIIVGSSKVLGEFVEKVLELGNPNYQVKIFDKPVYPIETEFGIWGNKLYLFSGTGKELYTIVVENSQIINTHKAIFELMWESLPDNHA